MASFWCVKDIDQSNLSERETYHKEWQENSVIRAETIALLKLMEVLNKKGKHISHSQTQIGFDNK